MTMRRHTLRAPRGQSTVEMALGLTVFVSILVWGIHFAELGFLGPKVHEAAANALWDTTARKMHRHPNDYSPREKAIELAGSKTTERYGGFDGRTSQMGKSSMSLVFTQAKDLTVTCTADNSGDLRMEQVNLEPYEGGSGNMLCHAGAKIQVFRFPRSFLDKGDGLYSVENYPSKLGWFSFCSMGLAKDGNCDRGKLTLMLDDWGLSGADESQDHLLDSGGNEPFAGLVRKTYEATGVSGMSAGYSMAAEIVQMPPPGVGDSKFWMSYQKGKPDPEFTDGDEGPNDWMTNVRSGSRNGAYKDRGGGWPAK